jgi:Pvc16 N-terminal domain
MIDDLDESLRKVILEYGLNGSGVELTFDAPTKEWAARRNVPTVDLYLYDIREDLDRRDVVYKRTLDENGRVVDRRPPARRFALSYLVTAWTKRPEDEHRLLARVLSCFLRLEALPDDMLAGSLKEQGLPVPVKIALPPAEDRSISDLWTALGGELKPSLDLVLVVPFDTARVERAGPPVLEEPRFRIGPTAGGEPAEPRGRVGRRARGPVGEPPERPPATPALDETIEAGTKKQPGRTLRLRSLPPADE